MKRPLVRVALLYGGGLLLAEFFHPPLLLLFSVALGLAALCLCSSRARTSCLVALIVLAGWVNLSSRRAIVSPHDLRNILGENARIVTIRGTLLETPSQRMHTRDEKEFWRSYAQIEVSELAEGEQWRPAWGRVLATTPGIVPLNYSKKQIVEINGVLKPPDGAPAEGLFDYRAYLRNEGIYYVLKADSTNDWRNPAPGQTIAMGDRFLAWAKHTLARGLPEEDESLRLLWAMTLGWKTGLTNEISEPFMRSGTMHIFAISGLHIALIAGLLVSLLRVLQVKRAWCGLIVIPLIWFYTGVTGWQPSAIRSTVMMTIVIGGWSLQRPSDLLNSLAAAAFIILLWDPHQLFGASFQLSFFVVLSIALLVPPIEKARDHLLRHDPLLPEELVPRWQRWLRGPLRVVTTSLATSLAAWLGALPLTAYYFHLFSPVTLLANLVIVPLSTLALCCNLASLICGDWFPWATELFNHSAWWWMECMVHLSNWSTQLPKSFLYVREPSAIDFIIYYSILIGVLSGWVCAKQRRPLVLAGLTVIASFYLWQWRFAARQTKLTLLPLNGGSAIFCDLPGRRADLLIDCGNTNSVQFTTQPFLRAHGVNTLPVLLISHGDVPHAGGAELIAQTCAAKRVIIPPLHFQSSPYNKVLQALNNRPEKTETLALGDRLGLWTVLHPDRTDSFRRGADKALVLIGDIFGTRVLLLSDLGRDGQEKLIERHAELRADIVITGIPPGGDEPVREGLLDSARPQLIVVLDSKFPDTARAKDRLRDRLIQRHVPVIYTSEAAAVTFTFRSQTWRAQTMTGVTIEGRPSARSRRGNEAD